jgi:hypothetical protein
MKKKLFFSLGVVFILMAFTLGIAEIFKVPDVQARMNVMIVGGETPAGGGGTDWTADSNLKALYYFEDANFSTGTVDSDGNNDLDIGTAAPTVDSSNYIEGSQAATLDATGDDKFFKQEQTSLDSDFPQNGTGDGEITFACWIRITTFGSDNWWMAISSSIADFGNEIFGLRESDAAGELQGNADGSSNVTITSSAAVDINSFYFVALVYSDAADYLYLYKRKEGAGSSTWESQAADIGTLDDMTASGGVLIGNDKRDGGPAHAPYGQVDACVFINGDALTQAELDGVFTNGWDGNGW